MIRYIGKFPPPYGGVTIKNDHLYRCLAEKAAIGKIDSKGTPLPYLLRLFAALCGQDKLIIAAGNKAKRRRITQLLARFWPKRMDAAILLVMGGSFATQLSEDAAYRRWCMGYRHIYVETRSMQAQLKDLGLDHVSVYPNCRRRPAEVYRPVEHDRPLRCLFLSLISKVKGAAIILEAAAITPEIQYAFYGPIDGGYQDAFLQAVSTLPNVRYEGIFRSDEENIYAKLHTYDVVLLPTIWKDEGLPGILIEAKMAATPAVVSPFPYADQIIRDGADGLILPEVSAAVLAESVQRLDADRALLQKLKQGASASAETYNTETYAEGILQDLQG